MGKHPPVRTSRRRSAAAPRARRKKTPATPLERLLRKVELNAVAEDLIQAFLRRFEEGGDQVWGRLERAIARGGLLGPQAATRELHELFLSLLLEASVEGETPLDHHGAAREIQRTMRACDELLAWEQRMKAPDQAFVAALRDRREQLVALQNRLRDLRQPGRYQKPGSSCAHSAFQLLRRAGVPRPEALQIVRACLKQFFDDDSSLRSLARRLERMPGAARGTPGRSPRGEH